MRNLTKNKRYAVITTLVAIVMFIDSLLLGFGFDWLFNTNIGLTLQIMFIPIVLIAGYFLPQRICERLWPEDFLY